MFTQIFKAKIYDTHHIKFVVMFNMRKLYCLYNFYKKFIIVKTDPSGFIQIYCTSNSVNRDARESYLCETGSRTTAARLMQISATFT